MAEYQILIDLLAASLTLMTLSLLYSENKFFRFAEHTVIGVYSGYGAVIGINSIIQSGVTPLALGAHLLIIPLILGALMYTRFVKKVQWVSRWPIAIYMGVGIGLSLSSVIVPQIIRQITSTALPLFIANDLVKTVGNWLTVILVIGTLTYFFYSREHKGAWGVSAKIGLVGIMAAMGAAYANTALARFSLLVARLQFLAAYPGHYVLIGGGIFLLAFLIYKAVRSPPEKETEKK